MRGRKIRRWKNKYADFAAAWRQRKGGIEKLFKLKSEPDVTLEPNLEEAALCVSSGAPDEKG